MPRCAPLSRTVRACTRSAQGRSRRRQRCTVCWANTLTPPGTDLSTRRGSGRGARCGRAGRITAVSRPWGGSPPRCAVQRRWSTRSKAVSAGRRRPFPILCGNGRRVGAIQLARSGPPQPGEFCPELLQAESLALGGRQPQRVRHVPDLPPHLPGAFRAAGDGALA